MDIRSGQILHSVSTIKTIYSYEVHPSVFKFVNVKDLAEFELQRYLAAAGSGMAR